MKSLMDMMVGSCDQTRALFSAHLEGELKGMRRVRVRLHLAGCSACSTVVRSLQATIEKLQELGDEFAPPPTTSVVPAVIERSRRLDDE